MDQIALSMLLSFHCSLLYFARLIEASSKLLSFDRRSFSLQAFEVLSEDVINDFSGKAVSHYDGHELVVDSLDEYLEWSGETYKLENFHFHTP